MARDAVVADYATTASNGEIYQVAYLNRARETKRLESDFDRAVKQLAREAGEAD